MCVPLKSSSLFRPLISLSKSAGDKPQSSSVLLRVTPWSHYWLLFSSSGVLLSASHHRSSSTLLSGSCSAHLDDSSLSPVARAIFVLCGLVFEMPPQLSATALLVLTSCCSHGCSTSLPSLTESLLSPRSLLCPGSAELLECTSPEELCSALGWHPLVSWNRWFICYLLSEAQPSHLIQNNTSFNTCHQPFSNPQPTLWFPPTRSSFGFSDTRSDM